MRLHERERRKLRRMWRYVRHRDRMRSRRMQLPGRAHLLCFWLHEHDERRLELWGLRYGVSGVTRLLARDLHRHLRSWRNPVW